MNTVLFDLDGTLLPMDLEDFMQAYFGAIGKKSAENGYNPKELVAGVWTGTKAMMKNDGSETNETRFWNTFARVMGDRVLNDRAMFDSFYDNEFCRIGETDVSSSCGKRDTPWRSLPRRCSRKRPRSSGCAGQDLIPTILPLSPPMRTIILPSRQSDILKKWCKLLEKHRPTA